MADRISGNLQDKISARLRFYQDIGIDLFYRDRAASASSSRADLPASQSKTVISSSVSAVEEYSETIETVVVAESPVEESPDFEDTLPRTPRKPVPPPTPPLQAPAPPKIVLPAPKSGLFDATEKVSGDSLLKIRDDIGDCTRCKLHKGRNKIVFADGNPKAKLVFVGEGPGRDEDMQGLPFVGRAGKLLTSMIEAMGLQRQDVYICNVVKCRPPENRLPEPDEIKTCSPFLLRQLDVVDPQVIVALGACAAQTLLQTTRGISHFR